MVARGLLVYSAVSVLLVLLCVAETLHYSHQLHSSTEALSQRTEAVPWPSTPFSTLSSVVASLPFLASPSLSRASPSVFAALFVRFRLNVLSVVNLLCSVLCLLTGELVVRVFSPLSDHEKKACRENLFNFLVFRCVFVAAVVPLELRELVCWFAFFSLVAALRVVIIVARERFTSVTVQPTAGADVFVRLIGVMLGVCIVDVLVAASVWLVLLRGDAGASVQCLMLFEHVVLLLGSLKAGGKYVIHLLGLQRESAWEERNSYLYYCEFVFECLIQLLTIVHYVHVWWLYGLSVTIIDLFLFLHLRSSSLVLFDRVSKYHHYRRASVEINSRYADATREELDAADDFCAVCRETMDSAKKLPCVTGDHRVLTRSGWKSITQVSVGDQVLSFNTAKDHESGQYVMEWKPVTATQSHVLDSTEADMLYRMEGSGMDVVATHNHSMLIARRSTETGLQRRLPFEYKTVGELKRERVSVHKLAKFSGFDHSVMKAVVSAGWNRQAGRAILIPDMERVCMWWWHKDGQLRFLQFLGFWLGDGHLGTQSGYVCIGQRKLASTDWLVALLDDVFPNSWFRNLCSEDARGVMYKYHVLCPPLYEYLRKMAIGPQGYNPRNPAQLRSYPHFIQNEKLAAEEQTSAYYQPFNTRGFTSAWTQAKMLRRFLDASAAVVERCWWCDGDEWEDGNEMMLCDGQDCHRGGHLHCAGLTASPSGDWLCPCCVHFTPYVTAEETANRQHVKRPRAGSDGEEEEEEVQSDVKDDDEQEEVAVEELKEDGELDGDDDAPCAEAVEDKSMMGDEAVGRKLREEGKSCWYYRPEPVVPVPAAPASVVVAPVLVGPPVPPPVPNPGNVPIPAGAAIVPWNNGWWIIINGHWYYLKRWLGDQQQIHNVYSLLSRQQAIALLQGFCRADGQWCSIQFTADGEPTGSWRCSSSSFPLVDHLMLVAQLAGAAVSLELRKPAGYATAIDGRTVTFTVDHWRLFFHFTSSNARDTPSLLQLAPLARPVPVSDSIEKRGYYKFEEDNKQRTTVYDITVKDNHNFLTQRLSVTRVQSHKQTTGVKAHSVFIGNCGHLFHRTCITQWMEYKGICPSCRAPLLHTAVARDNAAAQARQQQAAQQQRIAAMYPGQAAARIAATGAVAQPQPPAQPHSHSHSQSQPAASSSSSSSHPSANPPINDDNLEATLALIRQLQAQDAAQLGGLDFGMLNLANGLAGRVAAAPVHARLAGAAAAAAAGGAGAAEDRQNGAGRPLNGLIGRSLFRISSSSIASWLPSFTFELVRGAGHDDFTARTLAQPAQPHLPPQPVTAPFAPSAAPNHSAAPRPASPQPAVASPLPSSLSSSSSMAQSVSPSEAENDSKECASPSSPLSSLYSAAVERKDEESETASSSVSSPLSSSTSSASSSPSLRRSPSSSERSRRDLMFQAFQRRSQFSTGGSTGTTTPTTAATPPTAGLSTDEAAAAVGDGERDDEKLDSSFDDINQHSTDGHAEESEWSDEDELVRTISQALDSKQRDVEHSRYSLAR